MRDREVVSSTTPEEELPMYRTANSGMGSLSDIGAYSSRNSFRPFLNGGSNDGLDNGDSDPLRGGRRLRMPTSVGCVTRREALENLTYAS